MGMTASDSIPCDEPTSAGSDGGGSGRGGSARRAHGSYNCSDYSLHSGATFSSKNCLKKAKARRTTRREWVKE